MDIETILQKIYDKSEDLKDMKKELKEFEKDTEETKELKKMAKDLRAQIKDKKDAQEEEWLKDDYYKDLREDIVKLKGDLAELKSKAYDKLTELASRGENIDMELQSGADRFRAQSKTEPLLYINGRKIG